MTDQYSNCENDFGCLYLGVALLQTMIEACHSGYGAQIEVFRATDSAASICATVTSFLGGAGSSCPLSYPFA